jgi:hypothetical protein
MYEEHSLPSLETLFAIPPPRGSTRETVLPIEPEGPESSYSAKRREVAHEASKLRVKAR